MARAGQRQEGKGANGWMVLTNEVEKCDNEKVLAPNFRSDEITLNGFSNSS